MVSVSNPENSGWAREWFANWGGILLAAFGAFACAYFAYLYFHWGGEEYKSIVSNVVTVVLYMVPCVLAWRASMFDTLTDRTRWAWRFVSFGMMAFVVGQILWIYFENYLGEQPFPSWADVGYLAYYPLMLAGLLLMVEKMRTREERINFSLDASIVMIGGGMVIWYFLLRPIAGSHDGDSLKTVLSLAYPIADLVLLLGIVSLLLRRTGFGSRWIVNLLLAGVVINFIADFVFSYQSLEGTYETGNPVDGLFTLACMPVAVAAHLQYIQARNGILAVEPNVVGESKFFWTPYLAVAVVYLVLVKVVYEHSVALMEVSVLVAGVVTALVVVRQFLFVRESTRTHNALTELQQRIQGIYSASTDAIGLADFEGTITEVNESFTALTGYRRDEIVGRMRYQDFIPEDHLERSIAPDTSAAPGRQLEFERDLTRKDGSFRTVTTTLYPVDGSDGEPAAMAIVIRDITDRISLEKQLTYQALHDPLTGLANRALLRQRVTGSLKRAARRDRQVALMFLDLDNFKIVNDTMGHAAGDVLLTTIAHRLESCLRGGDLAARLGGDEFAVLIEDITTPGEELAVATRLLEEIGKPVTIEGKDVIVGSSIGVARSVAGVSQTEDLLRNADVAMYTSKRNGKNRYSVFEDEMHAAVIERAKLEEELRSAITNGEFEVRYQPILDLNTEAVVALEALLKWNHPRGIPIGPAEFIPIAEEANLIGEIGRMVLAEACSQVARWQRTYKSGRPFALSVNISGRQFMDADFITAMRMAYGTAGLSPKTLILEITESVMMTNTEATVRMLEDIRKLGVRLAVDDFGTGYSSLSYLHKFPIDVLKIDSSFTEKIDGKEGAAMAQAIISMGETLSLATIAEGVETYEQAEKLKGFGCTYGQGYHFARPLNVTEMDQFLKQSFGPGDRSVPRPSIFQGIPTPRIQHAI
jgi:diguanylate cyclase (GGDEF)-like protein/PAS domain S-box-containing protein